MISDFCITCCGQGKYVRSIKPCKYCLCTFPRKTTKQKVILQDRLKWYEICGISLKHHAKFRPYHGNFYFILALPGFTKHWRINIIRRTMFLAKLHAIMCPGLMLYKSKQIYLLTRYTLLFIDIEEVSGLDTP